MKRKHSHCTQLDEFGIFTKINCTLTIKQVAELCFKSVRTVTLWNQGKRPIPPECVRLIRIYQRRELGTDNQWSGFQMMGDVLVLPTRQAITPQQLLIAIGVLEISAESDRVCSSRIVRCARAIQNINNSRRS
ncbi:regulator [Vibrio marisflavi]|uniref:Uncharacterized protein n=1 Tax=Vibrio marisflavi CECT 7928 TaxID=634439 RepID=A0ABM9A554_9VIBR|nr:regulator [Vibrio marisflavi]CAH0539817.1 hypothetical protein VMF7928_02473 [Vibrio marisflavi CECT 7928]